MKANLTRQGNGWLYWVAEQTTAGPWRQIGFDWFCVVDDFGNLIPVGRPHD